MQTYYQVFELIKKEVAVIPDGYYYKSIYEFQLRPPEWRPFDDDTFDSLEKAETAIQENGKEYEKYVIHKVYTKEI